jgi:hypothetical protein
VVFDTAPPAHLAGAVHALRLVRLHRQPDQEPP